VLHEGNATLGISSQPLSSGCRCNEGSAIGSLRDQPFPTDPHSPLLSLSSQPLSSRLVPLLTLLLVLLVALILDILLLPHIPAPLLILIFSWSLSSHVLLLVPLLTRSPRHPIPHTSTGRSRNPLGPSPHSATVTFLVSTSSSSPHTPPA